MKIYRVISKKYIYLSDRMHLLRAGDLLLLDVMASTLITKENFDKTSRIHHAFLESKHDFDWIMVDAMTNDWELGYIRLAHLDFISSYFEEIA